jgi:hypothetical protein
VKNGPARERQSHRAAGGYGRQGKVPSLYPSGMWPAVRRVVLVELRQARVAAFGYEYQGEARDVERIANAAIGE